MQKLLYKGRLLALYKRTVTLPNGYKADLEVVRHPGAALVVPLLTSNKIILLRQLRPVINSYIYELPAVL
jgi:ADP-ribose pyrophosphatase